MVNSSYTAQEMEQTLGALRKIFDVARLVDPINMVAYTIEDGQVKALSEGCFHVWKKTGRCENCISSKCYMQEARYSKFEFIDKDIYHVVAKCVMVDGHKYVLEVVTSSNDNVLVSAFGNDAFVERINDYNHKVYTDELTGVSNRRYLNERIEMAMNRAVAAQESLAALMVDLDDFKGINDTLGHLAGDEVLKVAGAALKQAFSVNDRDIVARYGGDEFFVVLRGVGRDDLGRRIGVFRELLAQTDEPITASIGAFYQPVAQPMDSMLLIRRADESMYRVKAAGKNSFRIDDWE